MAAIAIAAPLAAQTPVAVVPGDVVTVVPSFEVPAAVSVDDAVRWVWDPPDELHPFGETRGRIPVPAEGSLRIPIAFALDHSHPAGPYDAGRVVVEWPDGSRDDREIEVDVAAVREIEVELLPFEPTVKPGGEVAIPVRVVNRGNAADTVALAVDASDGWLVPASSGSVSVQPGGVAEGRVVVRSDAAAPIGARARVSIEARGRGDDAVTSTAVHVVRAPGPLAGFEIVPATVFVGSASSPFHPGGTSIARLEGGGAIGEETALTVRLGSDGSRSPTAFRRVVAGPEIRLGVRRPTWEATLGDVASSTRPAGGGWLYGRGIDLTWDRESWSGEALATRPSLSYGSELDGHDALVSLGRTLGEGRVSAILSDVERSFSVGTPGSRATIGALRYALDPDRGREIEAEIGWARTRAPDGRTSTGPIGSIDARLRGGSGSISAVLRRGPAAVPGISVHADEAYLAGRWNAARALDVLAWGHRQSFAGLQRRGTGESRSAGASLRFRTGSARGELGVETQVFETPGDDRRRDSAVAALAAPAGPVRLDVRARAGTSRIDDATRAVWTVTVRARYSARRGFLSLEAGRHRDPFLTDRTYLDAHGTLELGRARIDGAVRWQDLGSRTMWSGWAGTTVEALPGVGIVSGIEYHPLASAASPWGLSIGIEKRLSLPLPIPRGAVARGEAFEDVDGDGRRGPGEPAVEGLIVRAGPAIAETDRHGRFEITDEIAWGHRVEIDVTTLDPALHLLTQGPFRARGEIALAVSRSSTIELYVFRDDDGDATPDEGDVAASGSCVVATGPDGRERVAVAGAGGTARIVVPRAGVWKLRVTAPSERRREQVEVELEVEVPYGENVSRSVALPGGRREIRFATDDRPVDPTHASR